LSLFSALSSTTLQYGQTVLLIIILIHNAEHQGI
jgi:hypothetical protein